MQWNKNRNNNALLLGFSLFYHKRKRLHIHLYVFFTYPIYVDDCDGSITSFFILIYFYCKVLNNWGMLLVNICSFHIYKVYILFIICVCVLALIINNVYRLLNLIIRNAPSLFISAPLPKMFVDSALVTKIPQH